MKRISVFLIGVCIILSACNTSGKFDENLRDAHIKTIKPMLIAEMMTDEISKTWRKAIYDKRDSHGEYCSDFNDALQTLFKDFKEIGVTDSIAKAKRELKTATEKLSKHPNDRKEAFNDFVSLVTDITTLCNMATDPEGSLTSFNQDVNSVKRDIKRKLEEFSLKYGSYLEE